MYSIYDHRSLYSISQEILRTVFALLCFVVVIHWLVFPYPSGLLHWHCGNLTIAPVPAKQPWWIWINTSCEFIMNDCITTTKQSTTKPCAYFLGYTVSYVTPTFTRVGFCHLPKWFTIPGNSSAVVGSNKTCSGITTCTLIFQPWWHRQYLGVIENSWILNILPILQMEINELVIAFHNIM